MEDKIDYNKNDKDDKNNNYEPDLLITAIRPSDNNNNTDKQLYNKMKNALELDLSDLEKVSLSSISCSYKKDAKDNLLIQLEKTPLELIKEEIRKLFK